MSPPVVTDRAALVACYRLIRAIYAEAIREWREAEVRLSATRVLADDALAALVEMRRVLSEAGVSMEEVE